MDTMNLRKALVTGDEVRKRALTLGVVAELRTRLEGDPARPSSERAALLSTVNEVLGVVEEGLRAADEELRAREEALIQLRLAMEAERQRYVDLFESAPDPLFVTDRAGVIEEANRAAALALQMPASFLVRKPLINFVTRSDCKKLRAALARLKDVARVDLELRVRPRHHKPIFLAEVLATRTRNVCASTMSIRWQMRDGTARQSAAHAGNQDQNPIRSESRESSPALGTDEGGRG